MKKLLIIISLFLASASINAQEHVILKKYVPSQGDMAVGFDMISAFKTLGHVFYKDADHYVGGNPITEGMERYERNYITPDFSVMYKYMITDNIALRANIGFTFKKDMEYMYIQDDAAIFADPFSNALLIDKKTTYRNGLSASLGAEYRLGKKRIQGVFGLSAIGGYQQLKTTYQYANQISSINPQPSAGWKDQVNGYRVLERKGDRDFFIGLSASIGAEYFVTQMLAFGAEVNICGYYYKGGQQYTYSEGYNSSTEVVETRYDLISSGNKGYEIGTDCLGGSLYISLYF